LNGGITSGDGAIARDCDSIELKDEDETDCETDCDKCDTNGVAVVDNVDDDDMDADGDECASDVEIGGGATTMLFFFFFLFFRLITVGELARTRSNSKDALGVLGLTSMSVRTRTVNFGLVG